MSVNLLIPDFVVPPSQLAANLNESLHNTLGPGRSNPLTEPGRRLSITLPNPNPQRVARCLNLPPSELLKRLAPTGAIPVEPAAFPYDPANPAADSTPATDKPYHAHRIPSRHDQLNPLNPAASSADPVNQMIDMFV